MVCSAIFSHVFHAMKFSVFIPRKDQCDVCVSFKHGNTAQPAYTAHIANKDQARAEKSPDKALADDKTSVWTMDVQAVLLCPKTHTSAMYYKTKLQVHNLTMYNLKTKQGYCYVWDETEGDLSSEMFAYIQHKHYHEYLEANPDVKQLIIWSDGCGYQNRNCTVSNMYLHLAQSHGITVYQKYLVEGHTQMEVDGMHSTIERNIVADVYTPRDYVVNMQTARIRPSPYVVIQIKHSDVKKMTHAYVSSIRPGNKSGDPTVFDIRGLKYDCRCSLHFKLSFSGDSVWEVIPQRVSGADQDIVWVGVFTSRIPITARKFKDLQSMKNVIIQEAHNFFDGLPHM